MLTLSGQMLTDSSLAAASVERKSHSELKCYGEIGNHHRNSLNEELGHRSPIHGDTQRDTLDRTREELTLSL